MLEKVILRFGPAPGGPPLEFGPGPMTVFVGPNNSGKSLALKELHQSAGRGSHEPSIVQSSIFHTDAMRSAIKTSVLDNLKRYRHGNNYQINVPGSGQFSMNTARVDEAVARESGPTLRRSSGLCSRAHSVALSGSNFCSKSLWATSKLHRHTTWSGTFRTTALPGPATFGTSFEPLPGGSATRPGPGFLLPRMRALPS